MLNYCSLNKFSGLLLIFLIVSLVTDNAFAVSLNFYDKKPINFHGFISQAYLKTDENNFLGSSEGKGSLDYTEIGANVSFSPFSNGNLAMQLLSRRAGETDNGEIKLDFLLFDYRVVDKSSYSGGIRAGRIKNPFGLFNDTRDVSFTRESIILPQSIYFERTRDLSISSDGAEFYFQKNFQIGFASFQFVAAQPRVTDVNTEYALFQRDLPGDITGDISYLSRIMFNLYSSDFIFAYSNVLLDMEYKDPSTSTSINFRSDIFSMQYTYNAFSVTGEYAIREIDATDTSTGISYYVQLAYRLNFHWNVFVRNDILYQDKNDKTGSKYAAKVGGLIPAHYRFAEDVTIGAQYTLSSEWMFRAEVHSINGTAWLPVQDNPDLNTTSKSWKIFSLLAAYRF